MEQIVTQHGGAIQVESEPGKGSQFTLVLQTAANHERSTILLVEDDSSVRTTIVTFLELEGFAVEAVSNTRDAIERLTQRGYPLVISDIYIDDRTGIDVLMAASKQDPDCSVILMTARGTMETVMAATRNGAFDYLAKPFELDTLLEAVKRAIESRGPDDDEVEDEELPETEMIGSSARMVEIYKTVSQRGADGCDGDDRRRDRHRQRTGGAHDPPLQHARARILSCRWIAARSRPRCSKANCSAR